MRVLVTNARVAQAYAVVRALRPHAERVVATMSGKRPLGLWPTCHAAYSRLVDARYEVPDPEGDWRAGRIQATNTATEEAFIDAVLRITERERIDTIFPSSDPWVYVLSKNKARFEARGIVIPVPDYETVVRPLDKHATILAGQESGFPCPRTFLPSSDADVRRIAAELAPPYVIKPRFTSGGMGFAVIEHAHELVSRVRATQARHGFPLIQEFIPGSTLCNYCIVLTRDGELVSLFCPRRARGPRAPIHWARLHESKRPGSDAGQAVRLLRHLGWWGGATVQAKVDARDGVAKLMEVNPRLGVTLWLRTAVGINEPLMCVQIARNERPAPADGGPLGCLFIRPMEDTLGLPIDLVDLAVYRVRIGLLKRRPLDATVPPPSLGELVTSYVRPYVERREKRYSPYVRYGLQDPLPALIWFSKVVQASLRDAPRLGR